MGAGRPPTFIGQRKYQGISLSLANDMVETYAKLFQSSKFSKGHSPDPL